MKKIGTTGFYLAILMTLPFLQGCFTYYYGNNGWARGGGYYRGGRGYGGYYGGGRYGGGRGWGGIGGGHGGGYGGGHRRMLADSINEFVEAEPTATLQQDIQEPTAHLAHDFDISVSSAEKIIRLASRNAKEMKEVLKEMGLTSKDVAPLGKLKMPGKECLEKIASHLGEDESKIEHVIQGFISDIQANYK
jgi:hypothetical protein